jgi:uncharacterized protein (DUF427 family)
VRQADLRETGDELDVSAHHVCMAVLMEQQLMAVLPELRFQPTHKRVRVRVGATPVADTTRAVLVWEPMRVVASYALPVDDIAAELVTAPPGPAPEYRSVGFGTGGPPLLDPSVPFAVHTAGGEPLLVRSGATTGEAFRLADPALPGYVVLDFEDFDWWEEDEPIVGHPRDPFHRIDVCRSERTVRIEEQGTVLAETTNARLLFEGTFPMARYYIPREDVRVDLAPGTLDTTCAYKGHATHWTATLGDRELVDIAWSYEDPLTDATPVAGLVCFYQERADLFIDGDRVERVRTPWS